MDFLIVEYKVVGKMRGNNPCTIQKDLVIKGE
jgi:hypothetical protein